MAKSPLEKSRLCVKINWKHCHQFQKYQKTDELPYRVGDPIRESDRKVKSNKCVIASLRVYELGYIVSQHGVVTHEEGEKRNFESAPDTIPVVPVVFLMSWALKERYGRDIMHIANLPPELATQKAVFMETDDAKVFLCFESFYEQAWDNSFLSCKWSISYSHGCHNVRHRSGVDAKKWCREIYRCLLRRTWLEKKWLYVLHSWQRSGSIKVGTLNISASSLWRTFCCS